VCIVSARSALIESISTHKIRRDNVNLMCEMNAYHPQGVCDRVHFDSESSTMII
jgi:hypothetical protein